MGKCDLCGKFRKDAHLVSMQAEGDETWFECVHCMSDSDLRHYGFFPRTDNRRGMSFAWGEDLPLAPLES